MFHPCSLRALCPSSPPVQGSGRDYCRSPLPCAGGSSGQSPGPPSRPPPRGLPFICFSLVRSLFFPCSLRALCPSSPPCRVAVATIAAPRYPARGLVGAIPPARPAREQGGCRATSRIASARSAPSLLPRSRPAPLGASPFLYYSRYG